MAEATEQGATRVLKDLFGGAVGGAVQVLVGRLRAIRRVLDMMHANNFAGQPFGKPE